MSRPASIPCLILALFSLLATGPAGADAYQIDFDLVMTHVNQSGVWSAVQQLVKPPVLPAGFTLDPTVCDINGGFDISVTPIVLYPNGILDSDEFALVAAILANPAFDCTATGGTSHTQVHNAWKRDFPQAWKDLGGTGTPGGLYNSTIMRVVPDVEYFFTGAIMIGDQDTLAFPLLIINLILDNETAYSLVGSPGMKVPDLDNDYTILYPYLGWCGDADGDGCSNYNEYQGAKDQGGTTAEIRARYLAAAMNPAVHAPDCTNDRICDGTGGLYGEYFADETGSGRKLSNLKATRIDHQVTFDWGGSAPMPDVPANQFSVCWSGFVIPQYSETYTFHVRTDDGVRLWVNNELLVDMWTDHGATTYSGATSAPLTAGQPYPIRMEFYENGGDAVAWLGWESSSQAKKGIYEMYLTPGNGIGDRARDWIRNPANGHYYKLTAPMTWTDGNALAAQWGGYLTTVNNAAENRWILSIFGNVADIMYTGANDIDTEGKWVWAENGANFYNGDYTSGTTVEPWYTNWNTNEPNDSGDEDAGMIYSGTGLWNDLAAGSTRYCLVETDTGRVNISGPTVDNAIIRSGNATIPWGDNITLRVAALHPYGNVYYQWRKDGTDIQGADEAVYIMDDATYASTGQYSCVVSDDSHAMQESGAVNLVVVKMPVASTAALAGLALTLAVLGARRRRA